MLERGSIVALRGPLGAGKTCFVKGLARGLGIDEELTSPTYTIIAEYEGILCADTAEERALRQERVPLYHVDAYRLDGDDDFSSLGGEEIVFGNGISVIEWSERIPGFVPPWAFTVDIEIQSDDKRLIRVYRGEKE